MSRGNALYTKGDAKGAAAAFREAIRIGPDLALPHFNLGNALYASGDPDGALAEYQEAIRLEPDHADAHCNLGEILLGKGEIDGALAAYREVIRLKPDFAEAHGKLGGVLRSAGRFAESLAAFRRWQELGSTRPDRRDALAALVRKAERFAALEPRFAGVLAGTDAPSDAEEGACFAKMAYFTSRYEASAVLLTRAFRDEPALAEDLAAGRRYDAACAAALAGTGRGKDAPAESKRPPLRAQALAWLRADLALRERQLPSDAATVRQTLEHWRKDRDLAGIRDEEEIAKVPKAEREAFRAFWRDVDALLSRASGQGAPAPEAK